MAAAAKRRSPRQAACRSHPREKAKGSSSRTASAPCRRGRRGFPPRRERACGGGLRHRRRVADRAAARRWSLRRRSHPPRTSRDRRSGAPPSARPSPTPRSSTASSRSRSGRNSSRAAPTRSASTTARSGSSSTTAPGPTAAPSRRGRRRHPRRVRHLDIAMTEDARGRQRDRHAGARPRLRPHACVYGRERARSIQRIARAAMPLRGSARTRASASCTPTSSSWPTPALHLLRLRLRGVAAGARADQRHRRAMDDVQRRRPDGLLRRLRSVHPQHPLSPAHPRRHESREVRALLPRSCPRCAPSWRG